MDINEISNKVTASNQFKDFIGDLRGKYARHRWWHPRARKSGSGRGGLRVNKRVEAPDRTVVDPRADGK
jgi:hypothetical protein